MLPGDADIDAFLDGTSEEPGAGDAVQAVMGVLWESHGFESALFPGVVIVSWFRTRFLFPGVVIALALVGHFR